jgi:hypothetical protein
MSLKLKAVGLGLLAMMVTGAFAVMNATAETGGHFVSEKAHTVLKGSEAAPNHQIKFAVDGGTPIECTQVTYSGTTEATTVTAVTIKPHYTHCKTEGGTSTPEEEVEVTMNGCDYVFTIGKKAASHNTVDVVCGAQAIEIHHPNCTITVPGQTVTGMTYGTDTTPGGKHAITATATISNIVAQYHGGICIFLGTTHSATMTGSATLSGTTATGEEVGITATGSQDK